MKPFIIARPKSNFWNKGRNVDEVGEKGLTQFDFKTHTILIPKIKEDVSFVFLTTHLPVSECEFSVKE